MPPPSPLPALRQQWQPFDHFNENMYFFDTVQYMYLYVLVVVYLVFGILII